MEHTRQAMIAAGIGKFANEAHWFDGSQLLDVPFEIRNFGAELAERGLFRLPYPKVVYWWDDKFAGVEDAPEFAFSGREVVVNGKQQYEIRLFMKVHDGKTMILPQCYIDPETGDVGYKPEHVNEEGFEKIRQQYKMMLKYVTQMNGAMISRDVDVVRNGPTDRQIRRSKEQGREPGIVFHTLVLKPSFRDDLKLATGGTHASPRLHWRRGHFRDLSHGTGQRIVPVAPSIVGSKERGQLVKDYRVAER